MEESPEIITYDNGLRLILQAQNYADVCSINIRAASGSCYETPETAGTSHFTEHMLFKGTKTRSALQIAEETDEIGGVTNAYTSKDNTCFYTTTLSEHTGKALDILCDMIVNPLLDEKDTENERSVIEEELNMYADSPEDVCAESLDEFIWKGSMLSYGILGPVENIRSMTSDKLREHISRFYVPERIIISICGKFDREEIISIINRYFSSAPGTGNPPVPAEAGYTGSLRTVRRNFQQNQIILAFPGINCFDERKYSAVLAANILGGSSSSRLFQKLREEMGLVYSVDCFNTFIGKTGLVSVCAGLSRDDEDEALEKTIEIIKDFPDSVTGKELARAKEQAVSGFVMALENSSSRASRNGRLLMENGTIPSDRESIEGYRSVTLQQIRETSEILFDLKKISLCVTGKTKSASHYRTYIGR